MKLVAALVASMSLALAGCGDDGAESASSDLTQTSATLKDIQHDWSDFGVAIYKDGSYDQTLMDLQLLKTGAGGGAFHFKATLASTCSDDGRGLCGEAVKGTYTYGGGQLELTFDNGPKKPFVWADVRLT